MVTKFEGIFAGKKRASYAPLACLYDNETGMNCGWFFDEVDAYTVFSGRYSLCWGGQRHGAELVGPKELVSW